MTRPLTLSILATAVAAGALALGAGAAGAASTTTSATQAKPVPIVMGDPGCHWFSVAGKKMASLSVKGPTSFKNFDEAALIFTGKGFTKHLAIGKTLTITKAGKYTITMVGQASDDNHLKLVVS